MPFEHFQAQLVPCAIADFLGHARLLASLFVLRPLLGKKQSRIDQGLPLARNISHADRHLAVVDFSQPAAPLPRDADGIFPRLGEARRIEHNHSVLFAQLLAHLAHQLVAQWLVIPIRPPDKPLQRHPLLAKAIGNRFGILALKVREQALHERAGMRALLLADQVFSKRFHKPL